VKIQLLPLTEDHKEKVFGPPSVEVGQYFEKGSGIIRSEMESGHSVTPIPSAFYFITKSGAQTDINALHRTDVSFFDTDHQKIEIDDWDITHVLSDAAEQPPAKKPKKKKKTKSESGKTAKEERPARPEKKEHKRHKDEPKEPVPTADSIRLLRPRKVQGRPNLSSRQPQ
jgi:hypothetical protein